MKQIHATDWAIKALEIVMTSVGIKIPALMLRTIFTMM
jgi:hypothetical protein